MKLAEPKLLNNVWKVLTQSLVSKWIAHGTNLGNTVQQQRTHRLLAVRIGAHLQLVLIRREDSLLTKLLGASKQQEDDWWQIEILAVSWKRGRRFEDGASTCVGSNIVAVGVGTSVQVRHFGREYQWSPNGNVSWECIAFVLASVAYNYLPVKAGI